jgi:ectoine hydroxylase-related dioxygenase (phytanoyl-CoA dioxygenase family)
MLTSRELKTMTAKQVDLFEQNGFLIIERVLEAEQIHHLRKSLADLLNRDPERRTSDFVVDKGSTTALRNINHFTRYWIAGAELVRQPTILGVVRDLIGNDVRFHHTKVFLKPPFEGTAKEWHQDLWSYVDDDERERLVALGPNLLPADAPVLAAQVYLDISTEENGCLRFVPGSHTWGMLELNRDPERVQEDHYPGDRVVKAPAPAGSVALFHALTLHYSGPNRSAVSRHAPIIQYFAPSPTVHLRAYPADTPFGEKLVWQG